MIISAETRAMQVYLCNWGTWSSADKTERLLLLELSLGYSVYLLFYLVCFSDLSPLLFSILLDSSRGQRCVSFSCLHFYHAQGSAFPLLVDFALTLIPMCVFHGVAVSQPFPPFR